MATITVYTFEDADGAEDSFTTQDPIVARERGEKYRMKVIAHEYEWSDSETAWDFTPKAVNEDQDEAESLAQNVQLLHTLGFEGDVAGLETAFREWVLRQHIDINLDNVDFEALAAFLQE